MRIETEAHTSHSDRPNMVVMESGGNEITIGMRWKSDVKPLALGTRWAFSEGSQEYSHSISFKLEDFLPFAKAVVAAHG